MTEKFRPYSHLPPQGFWGALKFYFRMLLDLQLLTIFLDLRKILPRMSGQVLDVGCGESPYRFLLPRDCGYQGIDIIESRNFDYENSKIVRFDGENIPFQDELFDGVICTEVLEHVFASQNLVNEMYRVLKKNGTGVITIPWSARYHYIPHDYFRYTPSTLERLFGRFSKVTVSPRGTDIVTIASKVIVLWFRSLLVRKVSGLLSFALALMLTPVVILIVALAHVALVAGLGSYDDPLGYTVIVQK